MSIRAGGFPALDDLMMPTYAMSHSSAYGSPALSFGVIMAMQVCFDYGAPLSAFGFCRCSQGHHTRREHDRSNCQNQSAHGKFPVNSLERKTLMISEIKPQLSKRYLELSLPERLSARSSELAV